MCGIAGAFNYKSSEPVNSSQIEKMCVAIQHRGPDGQGVYLDGPLGLGHRRLSIIDLSTAADQPLKDVSGRFVLCYNGEIYNFKELKAELESKGHRFLSQGDSEVIIEAYKEWGLDSLERLNGIFAFALWDTLEKTLLLVRDPVGIKPLFFYDQGGKFLFGSEIKAVLTHPQVSREINVEAVDAFFTLNYTPAPHTGLKNVRQLMPGEFVKISAKEKKFGSFGKMFSERKESSPFEEELSIFQKKLQQTVKAQTIADVPVGAFLSGGLDSTAVAVALKNAGATVNLYNMKFDSAGYDESKTAAQTAGLLGMSMTHISAEEDIQTLPQKISKHLEEPTADSSSLAVYLLCKAAAKHVKVALSGDGADETLAGYETYRATLLASKLKSKPLKTLLRVGRNTTSLLPKRDAKYSAYQVLNRFLSYADRPFPLDHASWRTIQSDEVKSSLYTEGFRDQVKAQNPLMHYADVLREIPENSDLLSKMLWMDFRFYLPNDMLVKVDRMSMAHGLEVRVPFLDIEFSRYCLSLPSEYKLAGKKRKHILRKSLESQIPANILNLPKSGFNFPIEKYMRESWADCLLDTLRAQKQTVSQFLHIPSVENLVKKHRRRDIDARHELFGLLMFGLWVQNLQNEWK